MTDKRKIYQVKEDDCSTGQEEGNILVDKLKPSEERTETVKVDVSLEEKVNIFDLCAEMVKEEGVQYSFCLVGSNANPLSYHMQKADITRVYVRHESTVGFSMDDGWGRLTRRPGFVVCGPGTGPTNRTGSVVEAYASGAPEISG